LEAYNDGPSNLHLDWTGCRAREPAWQGVRQEWNQAAHHRPTCGELADRIGSPPCWQFSAQRNLMFTLALTTWMGRLCAEYCGLAAPPGSATACLPAQRTGNVSVGLPKWLHGSGNTGTNGSISNRH